MITGIIRYTIPVFGILGFGHAVYRVFIEKMDAKSMGMDRDILKMYGIGDLLMTIGWAAVLAGIVLNEAWYKDIAIFVTGMFMFDYLASLPSFKKMGDWFFKYWATAALFIFVAYCVWLKL